MSSEEDTLKEHDVLLKHTKYVFAKETDVLDGVQLTILHEYQLSSKQSQECLNLLDVNLGPTYTKVNGKSWKRNKRKEMKEEGLVYILFYKETELVGFMSFKLLNEDELRVIYLYEIQLAETLRGKRIGTYLIDKLCEVVESINNSRVLEDIWYDEDEDDIVLTGIGLTVFSSNEGAKKLYDRLGFTLHSDSPKDCLLGNGKTIKPPYYMLEKILVDN